MTSNTTSSYERELALASILNTVAERGAKFLMYTSALGAIALIPQSESPAEFVAASFGVNLLSNVIDRVANGERFQKDRLINEVESALRESNLNKLLTSDEFSRALARLVRNQDRIRFAVSSNEVELQRLSDQIMELIRLQSIGYSPNANPIVEGQPTRFYVLSQTSSYVDDLRTRVNELWRRSELLEIEGAVSRAIELNREALTSVEAAIASEDRLGLSVLDDLHILRAQAQSRYQDIAFRHEQPTTFASGNDFVRFISELDQRARQNPNTLVTYYGGPSSYFPPRVMKVTEALEYARVMMYSFLEDKCLEYLAIAQTHLDGNRPKEALAVVKRCDSLPGRYDESLGVSLSPLVEHDIKELTHRIERQVESVRRAERKLRLARITNDSVEAKKLLNEAREEYPYLPEFVMLGHDTDEEK